MRQQKYRTDIQMLRGVAVIAIIVFHAFETLFPNGYLGVDIFFVVSGFVVTPLILRIFPSRPEYPKLRSRLLMFYRRRFYRLAPALAVTLGVSAILVFLLGTPSDHVRFTRQAFATLFLIGNIGAYRYAGDYFSPNPNPLIHTWSLSVEEQIYLFLPLIMILILLKRKDLYKSAMRALAVIAALSFLSFTFPEKLNFIYSNFGIQIASQISFYSPIDRAWQFTLGGILYLFLDGKKLWTGKSQVFFNTLLLFGTSLFLFLQNDVSEKMSSVIITLLTILLITFRSLNLFPRYLRNSLEWLGDRSYSLYLIHMPLLYLAQNSRVFTIGSGESNAFQSLIAIVLTLALGALSYSMVENRFRGRGVDSGRGLKNISIALLLTLGVPLVIFTIMEIGTRNQYWGLNKNIARQEVAWELDANCVRMGETTRPCIYGSEGSKGVVLLIGDSHAAHLSQAVIDVAANQNWRAAIWTQGGCPVHFKKGEDIPDACIEQNHRILRWIESNSPTAVIVAEYARSTNNLDSLSDGLSRIKKLVQSVLLVRNVPIFPDVRDFMMDRPIVMEAYEPPKFFKEADMDTSDQEASNKLAEFAQKNGIETVNFRSLFCDGKVCLRFSDREGWLYLDTNHLSVVGAQRTIGHFEDFFDGMLKSS